MRKRLNDPYRDQEKEKTKKEEKAFMRKVAKGTMAFYLTRAGFIMMAGGCLLLFTLGLFGIAMLSLWLPT